MNIVLELWGFMQNSSIQNSPNEAEARFLSLVSSIPECFLCPNHGGFLEPRQPSHTGCPAGPAVLQGSPGAAGGAAWHAGWDHRAQRWWQPAGVPKALE